MNMKRIISLVLALCLCLGLAACGGSGDTQSTGPQLADNEAMYQVSVVDPLGNPYPSGVIVRFMQNGQQAAMQVADATGVARKAMEKGEYTVELQFTDKEAAYHYDASNVKLTADSTEAKVELCLATGDEATTIVAYQLSSDEQTDCTAKDVKMGCTYVELTVNERNYFLFAPTQAGTYKFYTLNGEGEIGYYGAPHFVQQHSAIEPVDGAITTSVSADMIGAEGSGTAVYVLGVDAKTENAVLVIERTGDAEKTISDEPWTEYATTHTPEAFTLKLEAGQKLSYVDIKADAADYQLVMGSDGFYHLGTADGPVMYINLGKEAPYLSLEIMIKGDGVAGGAPMRRYFYDENGEFLKKEDYTNILVNYFDCADKDLRVYPLTADLEYIIKNGGEGWWTEESPDYIFEDCNPELGWLFACCYVA